MLVGHRVMAPVNGAHAFAIQFQAAHEVRGGPFALHQAAAARLHFAHKAVARFFHHIGTPLQRTQVPGLDLAAALRIVHGAPEALVIDQGLVVNDQLVALTFGLQHPDPIGRRRIDGIALLQQQGARCQLGQGAKLHQDVGIERWVFKGLHLIAESPAQHPHQPLQGALHRARLHLRA